MTYWSRQQVRLMIVERVHLAVCLRLHLQAPRYGCVTKNYFYYFSTKTCVVGAIKNRLTETVLLSPQNSDEQKRIHYSCEGRVEKSVPRDHRLSSLGKTRDAKR